MKYFVVSVLLCLSLSGCSHLYKNADKKQPHAVLKFEKDFNSIKSAFRGQRVIPVAINGKRPNGWSNWSLTKFRVKLGEVHVLVNAYVSHSVTAYANLKFSVESNGEYLVRSEIDVDKVRFYVDDSQGNQLYTIQAVKQPSIYTDIPFPIYIPVSTY